MIALRLNKAIAFCLIRHMDSIVKPFTDRDGRQFPLRGLPLRGASQISQKDILEEKMNYDDWGRRQMVSE